MRPTREMRPRPILSTGLGGAISGTGSDHPDEAEGAHNASAITVDPTILGGDDVQEVLELLAASIPGGEPVETIVSSGTAVDLDFDVARWWDVTLDGNCTFTVTNPPAAEIVGLLHVTIRIDGTHTATFTDTTWFDRTTGLSTTAPDFTDFGDGAQVPVSLLTFDGGATYGGTLGLIETSAALSITDGSTTVDPTSDITFEGAGLATVDVTDDTGGAATVTITVGSAPPPSILLASDHATPFTFGEILQESDGSDFLYASA